MESSEALRIAYIVNSLVGIRRVLEHKIYRFAIDAIDTRDNEYIPLPEDIELNNELMNTLEEYRKKLIDELDSYHLKREEQ